MGVIITESDMQFGEYSDNLVFKIEDSVQYKKKLRQNGVRSCEFILRRGNNLCFIEAKKGCPNQITENSSEEKKIKYQEYIQEIVGKMRHSLNLYANIMLKRYSQDGVPDQLKDAENLNMRLILIVKNAENAWLDPFRDRFRKELGKEMRIWKIPEFFILNEEQARKKHFVL
jgi:hypothetical protein